jgi:hypothetical protein
MATLGLKEMGKFLWECRKKGGKKEGKDNKIFGWQWDLNPQPLS